METSSARTIEDLPERFNAAADLLDPNLFAGHGSKAAVIDPHGITSYAALADRVARMSGAFAALGVLPEQRVLLCLLDTVDFPTVFLGAIRAGVIPVPLGTQHVADDYRWLLANSGARAVFVSAELVQQWEAIARDFPHIHFVSSGGGPWARLDSLLASPLGAVAETRRDDVAFWLYTSGSTGKPKGAMHTHASMRLTANLFGAGVIGYCQEDVVLSVAKLHFAYGLGNGLSFPFAVGATVVLNPERPTPDAITRLIRDHRVSILSGVPTFFAGWFESGAAPSAAEARSLRVAVSAGESLPMHLGEEFSRRYGVDLIDGLGSTEMLHVYISQRPGSVRYGCTGRPVPGYEVRIVDDTGAPVPVGELGELQVRGPTAAIGYWRNRPKSRATFDGKWVRTGDRYSCDAEGWYSYGGRSDEMINRGGEKISPLEIEVIASRHPGVQEAAAYGVPHPRLGENLELAAVVRPDAALDPAELLEFLRGQLPSFKLPQHISLVPSLPKGNTGKLLRSTLRERAAERERTAAPPGNTIGLQIYQIWRALLGHDLIGGEDNFFELGGDSLLATQMLTEVEELAGIGIPTSAFFEKPTLSGLVGVINETFVRDDRGKLVIHATDGEGVPFFFCYGDFRGRGIYAFQLARMLDPPQPVRLINLLDDERQYSLLSMEERARIYLPHLLESWPSGPFRLGGFCNGGLLALAIARELEQAGREVELVVLVDARSSNCKWPMRWAARLFSLLAFLIPGGIGTRLRYTGMAGLWRAGEEVGHRKDLFATVIFYARRMKSIFVRDDYNIFTPLPADHKYLRTLRLMAHFLPRRLSARIVTIVAQDDPLRALNRSDLWRRLSPDVTELRVPGTHLSCITLEMNHIVQALNTTLLQRSEGY